MMKKAKTKEKVGLGWSVRGPVTMDPLSIFSFTDVLHITGKWHETGSRVQRDRFRGKKSPAEITLHAYSCSC